jgi:hypothetical protein
MKFPEYLWLLVFDSQKCIVQQRFDDLRKNIQHMIQI